MGLIESILETLFPPAPEPLAEVRRGRRAVIRGRVVGRDLIESPLTGTSCVYYRYVVEERRRSSVAGLVPSEEANGFWVVVEQDEAIAEFAVEDETGRAVVDPSAITVEGALPVAVGMPEGSRAAESRLLPGQLVEVVGVIDELDDTLDEDRGYRAGATRAVVRAPRGRQVIVRVVG